MIRLHASQRVKDWTGDDFSDDLAGLADDLVNRDAYEAAVNYGRKALDGTHRDDADPVVDVWVGHVKQFADEVPDRIAGDLADAANDGSDDDTVADVLGRIDAKLEALRSSVTRYAEPTWGAGWNGYGAQLGQQNILMRWELDSSDPCPDCVELADGSPYEQLPTWPGMGETQCMDRCKCSVTADPDSWDAALGGDA